VQSSKKKKEKKKTKSKWESLMGVFHGCLGEWGIIAEGVGGKKRVQAGGKVPRSEKKGAKKKLF